MKLHVALGADHSGFTLNNELATRLRGTYEMLDMGAHMLDTNDGYPDFAKAVAQVVASGQARRGVLVCGSGACACLCHDTCSAHQGVEHDDLNILCLGARVVGLELSTELVIAFLNARFSGEERHHHRLKKVLAIEHEALQGEAK